MSKFCIHCGAQIDENYEICTSCGAKQDITISYNDDAVIKTNSRNKFIIIAAAAFILILMIITLKLVLGGGINEPINNFCKAIETGKGKYIYKCVPEFTLSEQLGEDEKRDIIDELDDLAEIIHDNYEDIYGEDIKLSYEIRNKKEIKNRKLEDLEDDIEDDYGLNVNISKGYEVKLRLKVSGDDDKESVTRTFVLYKVDGKWCFSRLGVYKGSRDWSVPRFEYIENFFGNDFSSAYFY